MFSSGPFSQSTWSVENEVRRPSWVQTGYRSGLSRQPAGREGCGEATRVDRATWYREMPCSELSTYAKYCRLRAKCIVIRMRLHRSTRERDPCDVSMSVNWYLTSNVWSCSWAHKQFAQRGQRFEHKSYACCLTMCASSLVCTHRWAKPLTSNN